MLQVSPILLADLATRASQAIDNVLANGGARSPRPTGEVTAVRTMILDGVDQIADTWEHVLTPLGYQIELSAVFCHSRPQVLFTPQTYMKGTGRCELADLLMVIDHRTFDGTVQDRRAVLIQAKRHKRRKMRLRGSDWTQHELLSELRDFSFLDSIYEQRSRALATPLCGDPRLTAEYGGVEVDLLPRTWTSWLPVGRRLTGPIHPFVGGLGFGGFLAQMACGASGCGREALAGGTDDWSFTVDELLQVTGALPISASDKVSRCNGKVAGRIIDRATYLAVPRGLSAGGGPRKPSEDEYWPEGPISTIHLSFVRTDPEGMYG